MMGNESRAVTVNIKSADYYVFNSNGVLQGILIDLWKIIAKDLNISDAVVEFGSRKKMFDEFRAKKVDFIIERMTPVEMNMNNISKTK